MTDESPFVWREMIAPNHPATNGHFEGNPIIPGSVIFEYVRLALKHMDRQLTLTRINKAKFTHTLKPGEELAVTITRGATSALGPANQSFLFQCTDSKMNAIASGEFLARVDARSS